MYLLLALLLWRGPLGIPRGLYHLAYPRAYDRGKVGRDLRRCGPRTGGTIGCIRAWRRPHRSVRSSIWSTGLRWTEASV